MPNEKRIPIPERKTQDPGFGLLGSDPKLDTLDPTVHGTPNAPDALVGADHALPTDEFVLFARVGDEEFEFLQDLFLFQVPHANGLFSTVDIIRLEDRMFVGTRGDSEFGGWKPRREIRQHG